MLLLLILLLLLFFVDGITVVNWLEKKDETDV